LPFFDILQSTPYHICFGHVDKVQGY